MAQGQTAIKDRQKIDFQEPKKFKVIMMNDDITTFDCVIMILKTVFMKPADEAEYLTMKIDRTGQAVVGIYSYDIARSKQRKATSMARNLGFPLVINVEPAE
ncbi:MAG: ATP-dependent Clp protease adaptor ClpS [Bacteroidaceae bacterium]|jgi:ATP-dependent Clp protease adaptor protein ClpS|nr:ATP-dependent Clp protease adaptor ClpS [Bacteroidaceae bacterium]